MQISKLTSRRTSAATPLAVIGSLSVAMFLMTACSTIGQDSTDTMSGPVLAEDAESAAQGGKEADGATGFVDGATTDPAAGPRTAALIVDRDVIRTAAVQLRAEDVTTAAGEAVTLTRTLGGLVATQRILIDPADPDRTTADLTLRVPSDRLDDLVAGVTDLGDVLEQSQQADDVTAQVVDIDARVESQRASVRRLQALLSRANTIGEVVEIESQLAIRQADLEALEAQQKSLADQTSLATLSLVVVGPDPVGTVDDPKGFLAGLDAGWAALSAAVVTGLTAFGAVVPFLGVILVVTLPLALWLRSRTRRSASTSPIPDAPPERIDEQIPAGR